MTDPSKRYCEFCQFCETEAYDKDSNVIPDTGECRRHAPPHGKRAAWDDDWPLVGHSEWCGEFQFDPRAT